MVKFQLFNGVGEEGGITVDSVRSFLNQNKENEIQFDIATLGGDLATGLLIHDLIKLHPKKCVANIVGLTASAGTVIALGCDEVTMSDNALFLIHNGWKEVTGNVYDMQKAASDLAKTDAIMVKIYREKTGLKDEDIKNIMKASDWMSPDEALNYKFIDSISQSNMKIAASAYIQEAQGKINNILLTKLEQKMLKNPFAKAGKPEPLVMNVLALKEGNLLINAELPAVGVEVAPLGAMKLEDGEYELADGRKIVVVGDTITELKPVEVAPVEMQATTEEIVAAVSALIKPVMAEVDALKASLASISSSHKPAKGTQPNAGNAMVKPVTSKIEEITAGIFEEIQKSRQA
jgi:ATP-dependent Clp protease protease subunit